MASIPAIWDTNIVQNTVWVILRVSYSLTKPIYSSKWLWSSAKAYVSSKFIDNYNWYTNRLTTETYLISVSDLNLNTEYNFIIENRGISNQNTLWWTPEDGIGDPSTMDHWLFPGVGMWRVNKALRKLESDNNDRLIGLHGGCWSPGSNTYKISPRRI